MMQRFSSFSGPSILLGPILLASALLAPSAGHAQAMPYSPSDAAMQMTQNVAQIQKVVDRWDDAANQHDQYALELVLAPQFIGISDTGQVSNRDQQVAQMLMKGAPQFTLVQKAVSVRLVGDVAIVNGTYDRIFKGSKLSHTSMKDEKGVFSQVYVRSRNTWQCVNSQRTLIVAPTAREEKKRSKDAGPKKSLTHDLAFKFPGFHRADSPDPQPPQ